MMVKHTRMEENRKVYEEDYDTDEYEDLTCECHHLARAKELNGSKRKPFFCIHCKVLYKDKNKLNLHRLDGCTGVTGDGRKTILKIYPVFEKGQRAEIEEILIKHGYMKPRKTASRPKRKKSDVPKIVEDDNDKDQDMDEDLEEAIEELEGGTEVDQLTPLQLEKLKLRGMLSSSAWKAERKKHNPLKEELTSKVRENLGLETSNPTSVKLTRIQVEQQAWAVAKCMQGDVSMTPFLEKKPCPGLWHLLQFDLLPSSFPNVNDSSFMPTLHEHVKSGSIDAGLRISYGTWYMEREAEASEEEKNAVKLTMNRFRFTRGCSDIEAQNMEVVALEQYLTYVQDLLQLEAQKAAADAELVLQRERYVQEKLEEFDKRQDAEKEQMLWHWSPLLHILKSDFIDGLPPRPWMHSDAEHHQIVRAIMISRSLVVGNAPFCPIIVRMFKMIYMYRFDKTSTLSDPATGLLRETIMSYSTSDSAACELRVAAQSILSEGYFLFGNMPSYSDAQREVQEAIQALLHGPEAACEAVIQKVQEFLKVVHQRAIGDMAQLRPHDFHVLWCGGDEGAISNALKEYSICLKTRENLDMGWVSSPLGHGYTDSIPVLQAKEAVVKAVNELYRVRLIVDKDQLQLDFDHCVTAAPDSVTSEKFHALEETCTSKVGNRAEVTSEHLAEEQKEEFEEINKVGSNSVMGSGGFTGLSHGSHSLVSQLFHEMHGTDLNGGGKEHARNDCFDRQQRCGLFS